jgi:PAS domain S-box-containing protein
LQEFTVFQNNYKVMGKNQKKPPISETLIGVFVVVSLVILITGSLYIRNQKRNTLDIKKEELNAYANLKASEIVRWWHERVGDAIILRENYPLVEEIQRFISNPADTVSRKKLEWILFSFTETFDYHNAVLLDNDWKVRLAVPVSDTVIRQFNQPLIPSITSGRKVMLTDIHRVEPGKPVQLDMVVPLELDTDTGLVSAGTIVMILDPEKILFPIVKSWPTSSKTSETLLIRKEGDSIIYLNELRHIPGQPLSVRRAIADTNLLGSKAIRGQSGILSGVDYRGVKVLGAAKRIAGSGWYMISKVDMKEIRSQVSREIFPLRLLIFLMISAFGALIGWTVWNQRVRFYRESYQAEVEKMALRKHFDYILKYANDLILLIDTDLNILEANDRVFDMYKYTREELIGQSVNLLRLPENDAQLRDQINLLNYNGTARYETVHRRKDGTTFPVEISARLFETESGRYYQSIARDITERKGIELAMNKLLERYNLAIRAAGLAVWDYNIIDDTLIWDDKVYELYGVDKDEFPAVYSSWLNTLHPEDRENANLVVKNAINRGIEYNTEFRIILPGDKVKYIKTYGHVVRDESGSAVRIIGINYDITNQKLSENLLREREFWLSESQKVGRVGSYIFDIQKSQWSSSDVLDDLFGIDKDYDRSLEGWNNIVHPDDKQLMLDYVQFQVIIEKNLFDKEYRIINRKTGMVHWVYGRGELRFDNQGIPIRLIGTIQDITERKKAELLLQETEQAYTGLFQTVNDAIYIHKSDGVFIDVNSGAAKMYGYSSDELIGKAPADVGAPGKNDMIELERILTRVFETGKSEQFEFWGKRKNGEIFPKEVVANKGRYLGQDVIISTARDITLRKNYEEQLKKAKEKAEESDRLKTAFLHNISHEIRTPMNAIVGFTALLDDPDIDADTRKHFINIIYQSTSQLLSIISDIVDISNIETGQVKLSISEVNINSVIGILYEQYKLTADQQKVLLHYEAKLPDDKAIIHTDKTKLIQVISNLLNNAFKFTKQGTIQFGYHLKDHEIEFFVRDTGIGVPVEKQQLIFDRFYQVEHDSARQYSGAGLGLSISKAYVELLGGKIWLESNPGKGSEFRFTHPV